MLKRLTLLCASVLLLAAGLAAPANAEVSELRIGKQYGLPYLQLIIMEEQKLIEKHAQRAGLGGLTVVWATMGGPAALNDGLISGSIDLAAIGLSNLVTLWDKTRGTARIRAIAGMNAMPLILLTRDPNIRSLKDYTEKDRIAVPSVKISMQAILLEMAAARAFGRENWEKLDPLTVSMGHPDAVAALSSGGEIASHFSSAPFQYRQLKQPGYRQVLSSYDIVGPHSVSALSMTTKFHDGNAKTVQALLDALKEATAWIRDNKKAAAETYLRVTRDRSPLEEVVEILSDPAIIITLEPMGADKISKFMAVSGRVKARPDDWRDYYFGNIDGLKGN